MELEETAYWLEILDGANLVPSAKLEALKKEADELTAIFVSLINKWKPKRS